MSLNFDPSNPGGGSPGFPSSTGNITLDNMGISFVPVSGNKAELWLAADTPLSEVQIVFESPSVDSLDNFVLDSSIGVNTAVSSMPDDAAPFELKIENFVSGIGGGGVWFYAGMLEFTLKQNITELGVNSDPTQTKATSLNGQNIVAVNFANDVDPSFHDFDIAWAMTAAQSQQDTPPTITLIGPNPTFVDYGTSFVDDGATAVDAEDGPLSYTTSGSVDTFTDGDYTITYLATDSDGNQASVSRTVTVNPQPDATGPVINLTGPNPQSIDYATTWTEPGYSAVDDIDGDVTSNVVVTGTVDEVTAGDYTITYTVSDSSGNQTVATRTVQVQAQPDTNAPVITLLGSATETTPIDTPWSDPGYTASDDMDGDLTSNVTVGGDYVDYSTAGSYSVTYSVFDAAGNEGTASRTVIVEDLELSAVVSVDSADIPSVTVTYGDSITTWNFSLVEDSSGTEYFGVFMPDTSLAPSPKTNVASNNLPGGGYTWTLSGTSEQGQTITGNTGTFTIASTVDSTPPVITLSGKYLYSDPQMSEINDPWVEPGVSAFDQVDGPVSVTTDTSGLDTSTIGTYYVTYSATDFSGNTATAQRVVVICDNASPVLTLNGSTPVTVTEGSSYSDAGATAMDGGGDISDQIVVTGTVDTATPGTYTLTYNVSDASGNAATPITRTVVVEAVVNAAPTITLVGDAMMMVEIYGGVWTEPGYTASDAEDGDLTSSVTISYSLDGSSVTEIDDDVAGTYTITYSVTDASGETGTATRSVMVGEHNCMVVEDLTVPGGTPNLNGVTVVPGGSLNYNGTTIDVSGYTSGNWASLAQNVGLTSSYITDSSLSVQQISGAAITDVAHWEAFPLSNTASLNVSAYVADRSFGTGIAVDSVQTAPVEETLIKFISYLGERHVAATLTLGIFERLSDRTMDYPFNWHCALDSKFAAQDVAIMASNKTGLVGLSEGLQYPRAFVEFRLEEMMVRGAIDTHTYHRKRFGVDGAGLVKDDGSKYKLIELQSSSPERHALILSDIKTVVPALTIEPLADSPTTPTQAVAEAPFLVYDQVHNKIDPANPTARQPRAQIKVNRLTTDVGRASRISPKSLVRSLGGHTGSEHHTPEFLGGLYSAETAKPNPSQSVLDEIVKVASDFSVDISSYTG